MTYIRLWDRENETATDRLHKLYNSWLNERELQQAHDFQGTEEEAVELIKRLEGEASGAMSYWQAYQ